MGATQQMLLTGGRTLWTPANLTVPPALWLDHTSSVTDAGSGACSQWNDKSGNGYHFTQGTSANRPTIIASGINGLRTIRGDGGNDYMTCATAGLLNIWNGVGNGWVMMVYKKTAADGGSSTKWGFYGPNNSGGTRFAIPVSFSSGPDRPTMNMKRLDGDTSVNLIAASSPGTAFCIMHARMDWTNGDGFLRLDGSLSNSNTSLTSNGNTSATAAAPSFSIFGTPTGAGNSDIEILAVLAGTTLPSSLEIEKLEGYYAYLGGLQANLPGGHPYKSAPPYL